MKKIKKMLVLVLALVMAVSVVGCTQQKLRRQLKQRYQQS